MSNVAVVSLFYGSVLLLLLLLFVVIVVVVIIIFLIPLFLHDAPCLIRIAPS